MVKISLNDNVNKLKEKSKAKNTQDKYNGDWLKFIDYCKNKYNCSPLDVDDLESAYALTANYMDWLHEDPEAKILKGTSNIPGREKLNNNPYSSSAYKASTIQRILASITYKYRINGFQFDRKNPNISETISAIVRDEKNNKSGQAKELLKADIEKIINKIPEDNDDFRNIRDKALILIGFYSFCRRSELLGMKFEHLNFEEDGIQVEDAVIAGAVLWAMYALFFSLEIDEYLFGDVNTEQFPKNKDRFEFTLINEKKVGVSFERKF